ncbi:unnamed protein product, partial [Prorocentrum cordatum]
AIVIEMECSTSCEKPAFVTSSGEVSDRLHKCLRPLAGDVTDSAVNLGIDDTVDRPRRIGCRSKKFKLRVEYLKLTTRKLVRMSCSLGRYRKRIWVSGALPGVLYGAGVHGISDFELGKI